MESSKKADLMREIERFFEETIECIESMNIEVRKPFMLGKSIETDASLYFITKNGNELYYSRRNGKRIIVSELLDDKKRERKSLDVYYNFDDKRHYKIKAWLFVNGKLLVSEYRGLLFPKLKGRDSEFASLDSIREELSFIQFDEAKTLKDRATSSVSYKPIQVI